MGYTYNQLIKGVRKYTPKVSQKSKILNGSPLIRGVVTKVEIRPPKRPNSARRKVAKVLLSSGKSIVVYIPGEKHKVQEHHRVLIEPRNKMDLPQVKWQIRRGALDCIGVDKRRKARSKYGTAKPKSGGSKPK